MRSRKKAIILCICAVLMVMGSIAGTLAYITAEDTNVNTFTVGKVKLELDEARFEDGTADTSDRVKENAYKLIPGQNVYKDPTVTVKKGSEEAYVRMILTIYNEPVMEQIVNSERHGLDGDYANLLLNLSPKWKYVGWTVIDEAISFEFRYDDNGDGTEDAVKPKYENNEEVDNVLAPLFTGLKVPASLTGEELALLEEGGFKIEVTAHAIQSLGFENADAAWAAFDEQMEIIATDAEWAAISSAAASVEADATTELPELPFEESDAESQTE